MNHIVDGYQMTMLKNEINIKHLISVHYFEYSKNYIFEGESHDFWEILYVDKGEINVMADERQYFLKKGELIFYKPNQWHNVIANGVVAPNLVVIAFDCKSKAMDYFVDKVLTIDDRVKTHLASIVTEAKNAYNSDLSDPMMKALKKRKKPKLGSEQLIRIHLELLLLEIIRGKELYSTIATTTSAIKEYAQEEKLNIIVTFLKEHLHERLTLEDICHQTLLSKSSLIKIFKEGMGISVMEHFKQLKIEEAKTLIREGNHNFTQISEILGYNSIHYFSRTFKSVTDMTLTEYASSVKMYLDDSSK